MLRRYRVELRQCAVGSMVDSLCVTAKQSQSSRPCVVGEVQLSLPICAAGYVDAGRVRRVFLSTMLPNLAFDRILSLQHISGKLRQEKGKSMK